MQVLSLQNVQESQTFNRVALKKLLMREVIPFLKSYHVLLWLLYCYECINNECYHNLFQYSLLLPHPTCDSLRCKYCQSLVSLLIRSCLDLEHITILPHPQHPAFHTPSPNSYAHLFSLCRDRLYLFDLDLNVQSSYDWMPSTQTLVSCYQVNDNSVRIVAAVTPAK